MDDRSRVYQFLLLGVLSMLFAEVFSASSSLWFLNPFAVLITMALYLLHTIFFLNLTMKTSKYRLSQLYLWGVLFGLYESWITKVLWVGYPGSDGPIFGTVLGIAVFEFSVLVFFYHTIFAFIIPLLVYGLVGIWTKPSLDHNLSTQILEEIHPSRKMIGLVALILVFAASVLAFNSDFNFIVALLSVGGTIAIILLLHWRIVRTGRNYELEHLELGRKGMMVVTILLIFLYVTTFFLFSPEDIPGILGFVPIIFFYLLPLLILWKSHPIRNRRESKSNMKDQEEGDSIEHGSMRDMTSKQGFLLFGAVLLLMVLLSIIPFLGTVLVVIFQLLVFIMSPILFIWSCYQTLHSPEFH